jgi:serine phosphatase RsbU (regulator of sigma subunit)
MPLGINRLGKFPTGAEVTLQPNEIVFLLSDGLLESTCPDGSPFGIPRALDVVQAHRHIVPREIIQALFCAVDDYSCRQVLMDDVTAVIIKAERDDRVSHAQSLRAVTSD